LFFGFSSSPVLKHTTASIFFPLVKKEKRLMQAGESTFLIKNNPKNHVLASILLFW